MATTSRQPFAPLDGSRLQNLTSLKNRQNAITPQANSKRKAELLDTDDSENVDPVLFAKRSKGALGTPFRDMLKKPSPSSFVLTRATITPSTNVRALVSPVKASTAPRRTLNPKSPIAKLNTKVIKSSPISAPAGRSPTHGKRSGILSNRRRTTGPYTRVDPPSFSLDSAAPFSLDAALKGTIPSYGSRPRSNALSNGSSSVSSLSEPDLKASWFFDIHEDSPEQEMTNLLQHGTCVLDISSDEESEQKARREGAEGRDKENIPPSDDVSQTSARRSARAAALDEMVVEKERVALGEMNTADFYAHGCDETSVIVVPADDDEQSLPAAEPVVEKAPVAEDFEFTPQLKNVDPLKGIDQLMSKSEIPTDAAVLQPIDGTGETFDLWESGSARGEAEPTTVEL
ncbi:hypothetical protein QQS21_010179 [Conoideocrella luteorostrata]|uniref:Thymidylate kinase n=1 Tax=Conoideocrella luteorostrata TaxID=1105319 RepID=A0AAJ0FUY1_9HYPO|nr:hypothetical protein QQS21_010179 [Conoideocrella luteorostrata]